MDDNLYPAIFIAALVTATIRLLPILFLSRQSMPVLLRDFLSFVPAGVLSAIVIAEIMSRSGQKDSLSLPLTLGACLLALLAGVLSRSLFATVIASILAFLLMQNL